MPLIDQPLSQIVHGVVVVCADIGDINIGQLPVHKHNGDLLCLQLGVQRQVLVTLNGQADKPADVHAGNLIENFSFPVQPLFRIEQSDEVMAVLRFPLNTAEYVKLRGGKRHQKRNVFIDRRGGHCLPGALFRRSRRFPVGGDYGRAVFSRALYVPVVSQLFQGAGRSDTAHGILLHQFEFRGDFRAQRQCAAFNFFPDIVINFLI